MKRRVRLYAFALSLVLLCGGLLAHRSSADARCVETQRRQKAREPSAGVPRELPALPGMRSFTRAAF